MSMNLNFLGNLKKTLSGVTALGVACLVLVGGSLSHVRGDAVSVGCAAEINATGGTLTDGGAGGPTLTVTTSDVTIAWKTSGGSGPGGAGLPSKCDGVEFVTANLGLVGWNILEGTTATVTIAAGGAITKSGVGAGKIVVAVGSAELDFSSGTFIVDPTAGATTLTYSTAGVDLGSYTLEIVDVTNGVTFGGGFTYTFKNIEFAGATATQSVTVPNVSGAELVLVGGGASGTTIPDNKTLTVGGGTNGILTVDGELTVDEGTLTVSSGGNLYVNGVLTVIDGVFTTTGETVVNGKLDVEGGASTITATSGALTVSGKMTVSDGTLAVNEVLEIDDGGELEISGGVTTIANTKAIVITDGKVTVSGSDGVVAGATLGKINIDVDGTLEIEGEEMTLTALQIDFLDVAGKLSIVDGGVLTTAATTAFANTGSGGVIDIGNSSSRGTLNIDHVISTALSYATINVNHTLSELNISAATRLGNTASGLLVVKAGKVIVDGVALTLNKTGGVSNMAGNVLEVKGGLVEIKNANGAITHTDGLVSITGGVLKFSPASASAAWTVPNGGTAGDGGITVSSGGKLIVGAGPGTEYGTLTAAARRGLVTIGNGGTLNINRGIVNTNMARGTASNGVHGALATWDEALMIAPGGIVEVEGNGGKLNIDDGAMLTIPFGAELSIKGTATAGQTEVVIGTTGAAKAYMRVGGDVMIHNAGSIKGNGTRAHELFAMTANGAVAAGPDGAPANPITGRIFTQNWSTPAINPNATPADLLYRSAIVAGTPNTYSNPGYFIMEADADIAAWKVGLIKAIECGDNARLSSNTAINGVEEMVVCNTGVTINNPSPLPANWRRGGVLIRATGGGEVIWNANLTSGSEPSGQGVPPAPDARVQVVGADKFILAQPVTGAVAAEYGISTQRCRSALDVGSATDVEVRIPANAGTMLTLSSTGSSNFDDKYGVRAKSFAVTDRYAPTGSGGKVSVVGTVAAVYVTGQVDPNVMGFDWAGVVFNGDDAEYLSYVIPSVYIMGKNGESDRVELRLGVGANKDVSGAVIRTEIRGGSAANGGAVWVRNARLVSENQNGGSSLVWAENATGNANNGEKAWVRLDRVHASGKPAAATGAADVTTGMPGSYVRAGGAVQIWEGVSAAFGDKTSNPIIQTNAREDMAIGDPNSNIVNLTSHIVNPADNEVASTVCFPVVKTGAAGVLSTIIKTRGGSNMTDGTIVWAPRGGVMVRSFGDKGALLHAPVSATSNGTMNGIVARKNVAVMSGTGKSGVAGVIIGPAADKATVTNSWGRAIESLEGGVYVEGNVNEPALVISGSGHAISAFHNIVIDRAIVRASNFRVDMASPVAVESGTMNVYVFSSGAPVSKVEAAGSEKSVAIRTTNTSGTARTHVVHGDVTGRASAIVANNIIMKRGTGTVTLRQFSGEPGDGARVVTGTQQSDSRYTTGKSKVEAENIVVDAIIEGRAGSTIWAGGLVNIDNPEMKIQLASGVKSADAITIRTAGFVYIPRSDSIKTNAGTAIAIVDRMPGCNAGWNLPTSAGTDQAEALVWTNMPNYQSETGVAPCVQLMISGGKVKTMDNNSTRPTILTRGHVNIGGFFSNGAVVDPASYTNLGATGTTGSVDVAPVIISATSGAATGDPKLISHPVVIRLEDSNIRVMGDAKIKAATGAGDNTPATATGIYANGRSDVVIGGQRHTANVFSKPEVSSGGTAIYVNGVVPEDGASLWSAPANLYTEAQFWTGNAKSQPERIRILSGKVAKTGSAGVAQNAAAILVNTVAGDERHRVVSIRGNCEISATHGIAVNVIARGSVGMTGGSIIGTNSASGINVTTGDITVFAQGTAQPTGLEIVEPKDINITVANNADALRTRGGRVVVDADANMKARVEVADKSVAIRTNVGLNPERSGFVHVGGYWNNPGSSTRQTRSFVDVWATDSVAILAQDSVLVWKGADVRTRTGAAIKANVATILRTGGDDPVEQSPQVRATGNASGVGRAIHVRNLTMTGGRVLAGFGEGAEGGVAEFGNSATGISVTGTARDSIRIFGGSVVAAGKGTAIKIANPNTMLSINAGKLEGSYGDAAGQYGVQKWVSDYIGVAHEVADSVRIAAGGLGTAINSVGDVFVHLPEPEAGDGNGRVIIETGAGKGSFAVNMTGNGKVFRAGATLPEASAGTVDMLELSSDPEKFPIIIRAGKNEAVGIYTGLGVVDSVVYAGVSAEEGGTAIHAEGGLVIGKSAVVVNGEKGTAIRSHNTLFSRLTNDDGTPSSEDYAYVVSRDVAIVSAGKVSVHGKVQMSGTLDANVFIDDEGVNSEEDMEEFAARLEVYDYALNGDPDVGGKLTVAKDKTLRIERGGMLKVNNLADSLVVSTGGKINTADARRPYPSFVFDGTVIVKNGGDITFNPLLHGQATFNNNGHIVLSTGTQLLGKTLVSDVDFLFWADTLTKEGWRGTGDGKVTVPPVFADTSTMWGGKPANNAIDTVYGFDEYVGTQLALFLDKRFDKYAGYDDVASPTRTGPRFFHDGGRLPTGRKAARETALDSGLVLDSVTGKLVGMLTETGIYKFWAEVKNDAGSARKEFTVNVVPTKPIAGVHFYAKVAGDEDGKLFGEGGEARVNYTGERVKLSIVLDTVPEWKVPYTKLGNATVFYRGAPGSLTVYDRTTIPPTDAGEYIVEAAFAAGVNFLAHSAEVPMMLGKLTIESVDLEAVLPVDDMVVNFTFPTGLAREGVRIPLPNVSRLGAEYKVEDGIEAKSGSGEEFFTGNAALVEDSVLVVGLDGTNAKNGSVTTFQIEVGEGARRNVGTGTVTVNVLFVGEAGRTEVLPTTVRVDYKLEALIGFEPKKTYTVNGNITVDGGPTGEVTYPIPAAWLGAMVSVRTMPTNEFRIQSDLHEFQIPVRGEAPEGVEARDETVKGNGALTGTTNAMEYRRIGVRDSTWYAAANDVTVGRAGTGLAAGTYEVRYSATDTGFASESVTLVIKDAPVSVAELDRDIVVDDEAAVKPVKVFDGEFTAGPNPVAFANGKAAFFWQGAALKKGTVKVFDANGNVVKTIKVEDKAASNSSRREIGAWNLDDAKGRKAAEGTYVVKGALATKDGKKVKVNCVMNVQ